MAEANIELLPCPFCASKRVEVRFWDNIMSESKYFVKCQMCGVRTDDYSSVGVASDWWNLRRKLRKSSMKK